MIWGRCFVVAKLYRRQWLHMVRCARLCFLDLVEEEAVQANLLSRTSCMFLKRQAGNDPNVTAGRVRTAGERIACFKAS